MRKIRKTIAFILLVSVLVAAAFMLASCNTEKLSPVRDYDEVYAMGDYTLELESEELTVLKINDMHLINGISKKDKKTLALLKSVLDKTPCDVIVLDGDVFEGYNSNPAYNKVKAAMFVGELVSGYGVPWTFAPGNNDGQKGGSNEDIIAFWLDYDGFIAGNVKGLNGAMQFFIDVTVGGELRHSLAIMDSHSLDSKKKYDYIKEDQIAALLAGIEERKVTTSVFFHMPTPAFKKAYTEGKAYEGFPFADPYAVDSIEKNALFDNLTADNGYIKLVSTGHVHGDNIAYLYNDRYYQLSSLGGYGAVGANKTSPSYTLTKINLSATAAEDIYTFEKVA